MTKTNKTINVEITNKGQKTGGVAHITPGESIRIVGERYKKPYDVTFYIGGEAVVGSFNLIYTGTITRISEKTVTVVEYPGSSMEKSYRMSLAKFENRNYDYNGRQIAAHNFETSMYI